MQKVLKPKVFFFLNLFVPYMKWDVYHIYLYKKRDKMPSYHLRQGLELDVLYKMFYTRQTLSIKNLDIIDSNNKTS